jgi:hypothetical protein
MLEEKIQRLKLQKEFYEKLISDRKEENKFFSAKREQKVASFNS